MAAQKDSQSSPRDSQFADTDPEEACKFLTPDTLVFDHFGPRIISIGDLAPVPSRFQPRLNRWEKDRSKDFGKFDLSRKLRSNVTQGLNRSVDVQVSKSTVGLPTRPRQLSRTTQVSRKFNLTSEEARTYDEFVRLLSSYPAETAVELLSDAHKDAKQRLPNP